MIAQLCADLDAADVPVIVGELGRFNAAYAPFNVMLPRVTNAVPRCALASSAGLGSNPDKVHFAADALRMFGQRYFDIFEPKFGSSGNYEKRENGLIQDG